VGIFFPDLVTKDGEWAAVIKRKSLFQSKTGNRQVADFKDGNRYRRLENSDAAVSMLAFWGFLDEARASRVFKTNTFSTSLDRRMLRPEPRDGPSRLTPFHAGGADASTLAQ
jgi:hypothetical protein